jgi:hypothetical protein
MLKRVFELFGLATMGAGAYFIFSEHSKQSVCNATEGKYVGFGMSPQCQHVVYAYFGGFVLLMLGLLVVVFGILATRKKSNRRLAVKNPTLASQYSMVDPKNARASDS